MIISDKIKISGSVVIALVDPHGLVELHSHDNLLVTGGASWIAAKLAGSTLLEMDTVALGTGSTAPVSGDTALEDEVMRDTDVYGPTQGRAPDTNTLIIAGAIPADTWAGEINEAGIFAGPVMTNRVVFPAVTKAIDQAVYIAWTLTVNG